MKKIFCVVVVMVIFFGCSGIASAECPLLSAQTATSDVSAATEVTEPNKKSRIKPVNASAVESAKEEGSTASKSNRSGSTQSYNWVIFCAVLVVLICGFLIYLIKKEKKSD